MEQPLHCPGCDARIGLNTESIPIQCWKCGLEFGDTDTNRPRAKEEIEHPWNSTVRFYGALILPLLFSTTIGLAERSVPIFIRSVPLFGSLKTVGCLAITVTCTVYALDRMVHEQRGVFSWLFRMVAFVFLTFANIFRALLADYL